MPRASIVSISVPDRVIHLDRTLYKPAPGVDIDSSVRDDGTDMPTTRIRKGNVLCKAATGRYVEADDADAVIDAQATVTALETADADWASTTITITENGIAIVTVTLAGSDDTDAEVAAALNADGIFKGRFKASVVSSRVVVKSLEPGAHKTVKVAGSLATAFGASGTTATGTWGEYVVTEETVDVVDENGTAVHAPCECSIASHYDESELITLTPEAKRALERAGARFG